MKHRSHQEKRWKSTVTERQPESFSLENDRRAEGICQKKAASRKVNWNAEKVAKRRVTSGELH